MNPIIEHGGPENPVSIYDEKLRVEWVNLGEGLCGDYDELDPHDMNVLRFDVYYSPEPGSCCWESVDDASYCTIVRADTDVTKLEKLLMQIFREYRDVIDDYPYASVKKLGERLSWISAKE